MAVIKCMLVDYGRPTLVRTSTYLLGEGRGVLPRHIAPFIAGALALASSAPARTPPRRTSCHSMRSNSRRRAGCVLSADLVASLHEFVMRLDDVTGQLCLVHQIALLLADVYGHCDKDSAALLKMSVPCYKLGLHRARSVVRPGRSEPPHPAGWLGVTCCLSTAQLLALRRELMEGLMT
jgi:hypothetical protein